MVGCSPSRRASEQNPPALLRRSDQDYGERRKWAAVSLGPGKAGVRKLSHPVERKIKAAKRKTRGEKDMK